MTIEEQKISAFTEPESPLTIGGHKLKPFTAQSVLLLQQVRSGFLYGLPEDPFEIIVHVAAFIFIHVKPFSELKTIVRNADAFRDAVTDFMGPIPANDLINSVELIKDIMDKGMIGNDYQVEESGKSDPNS